MVLIKLLEWHSATSFAPPQFKQLAYAIAAIVAVLTSLYLSMILGANFESETGPAILLHVSLLITFGGHLTTKKRNTLTFCERKREPLVAYFHPSLLQRSRPNGSRIVPSPTVQRVSPVLLPVQRLPRPATAFPTPGAGCCFNATPSQGRAGGAEAGCGRARPGLDWCGTLEQPHGRLLSAARC